MGKRYSKEETQLIIGLAQQSKSVMEIIEAVRNQFGVERSESAVKGHIKVYSAPADKQSRPEQR